MPDVFATAVDVLFADSNFGQAATYTPPSGPAVACTVIVSKSTQQQPGTEAYMQERFTTIAVRKSEVDQPKRGGTFLVGSTTYVVDKIQDDDGIVVTTVVH